jgi:hypothetical protein
MTDRADVAMRLVPQKFFLGHGRTPFVLLMD